MEYRIHTIITYLWLVFPIPALSQEYKKVSLMLDVPVRASLCVSVTDADVVTEDSTQADILSSLLLTSEVKGHVENPSHYFTDVTERKRQELDLLMLTQGWRRYDTDSILAGCKPMLRNGFETEQAISGTVKRNWGKVKEGNLTLFIPKTGYREKLRFSGGNRFRLTGLDFVDGTSILLQAANKKDNDTYMMLTVDKQEFPSLMINSMTLGERQPISVPASFVSQSRYQIRYNNLSKVYELPNLEVVGHRFRPMNRMKMMPTLWIGENDPILDFANRMDLLVARFGLSIGRTREAFDEDGEVDYLNCIRVYSTYYHSYIPVTIFLDGDLVRDYALEDIPNIDPRDVKQMEFFRGSHDSKPILFIYLNKSTDYSRFRRYKPLSMATVTQLGYKAPVEFYSPKYDAGDNPSFQLDQRTTLYWSPCVTTDSTGHAAFGFWPSSKSKSYRVKVEGITEEGEIIRTSTTIR